METPLRTVTKAITWQATGLVVMSLFGYLMTGSWRAAGHLAIGSAVIGMVMFVLHERIWGRIAWGRGPDERR